jgi:hypothetical protein
MEETLNNLLQTIKSKANGRVSAFIIGNTSSVMPYDKDFYFTPLEETSELIYGGVIVKNVEITASIAELIDGQVDYVFVDAEKKIKEIYYGSNDIGNIERIVREKIFKSKVLTYKGNSLATEAIDLLLGQLVVDLGNVNVAIIGAGNMGSKIALTLVERGAKVKLFRRNLSKLKKITDGLNQIKSEHTESSITMAENIEEACRGANVVIACADQQSIIKEDLKWLSKERSPILIDVGKKCFDESIINSHEFVVFSLDTSIIQKYVFTAIIKTKLIYGKAIGRKKLQDYGLNLISSGLVGQYGEFIVDDIDNPKTIIGVADGQGSLLEDTGIFEDKLNILRNLLN